MENKEMMNTGFEMPSVTVIMFENEDIVTTSGWNEKFLEGAIDEFTTDSDVVDIVNN